MTNHQMHSREFLIGAAVGSVVGTVAALLMAPKAGKRLRQDLCDAYCDLSDKTHDAMDQVSRKGKSFAKNVGCRTGDWTCRAKSAMEGLSKGVRAWSHEDEEEEGECCRDLLVGGLAGGILGAVAGLLLAPKSGDDLRQDIADTYHDVSERTHDMAYDVSKKGKAFAKRARSKTNKWLDLAKQVVEELTEDVEDTTEEWAEQAKHLVNNSRVHDMMDWASLGFRVWKNLKAKR